MSAAIFLAAVPFAKLPLAPVWAFIPIYESALVVNDLITAVLLFGQFSFLRSRALLVLASGYLFTAFIADRARADVSRLVRADRPARRRPAEHRVAVHVLARRLPAVRHRVRARWRAAATRRPVQRRTGVAIAACVGAAFAAACG